MKLINNIKVEIVFNGEMEVLDFNVSNDSDKVFNEAHGLTIKAITDNTAHCYKAERVDNSDYLKEHTDLIAQLFIDKYNEFINQNLEDLENGIETTNENILSDDPNITIPYDPNSIRVTQGRFSLREVFEMITGTEYEEPILDLSPDFQRNYVWDNTRKSRLIESILLKIPLPVFYLARDNEGKYQVVDGVQRLSVIKEFFSNGFRLKNLEYLNDECDNKYFQRGKDISLHPKFVRLLRAYQIDCNIIEPDTPHRVKSDIFKRLNTGGRSLNNQEIRNSILRKEPRDFIRKLASSNEFKLATNNSISPKRMMDQELVLRFIGFYFLYKSDGYFPQLFYNGIMDEFLDNVVEILNKEYKIVPFDIVEKDFYLSMENAYTMFGTYAFRKVKIDYKKGQRNMINKSLFTTYSVLLSNYNKNQILKHGNIIKDFAKCLEKDEYLYDSITYGTNDRLRIDTAFIRIEEFLKSKYGGLND